MLEQMLVRCGEPSKYDHSPFGTVCMSSKNIDGKFEIHVQISSEESMPIWESLGIFSHDTKHLIPNEISNILSRKKGTVNEQTKTQ